MTKEEVCARIVSIGILPGIRVSTADDALFAAHQMVKWGIPVVELTMTVPGAIEVIAELVRTSPELMVGAGTVLDVETARACLDAGAAFITSPGMDIDIVEFTVRNNVASIPGALTPSEVMAARKAGADLIKIFPCVQVGGPDYIRALKAPFPHVPFIASGGVNQLTAADFIRAGAAALGIRGDLIPPLAIERRDENWIHELTGRFLGIVQHTRVDYGLQYSFAP
jgi:2-dehydro-3-deoxyphosphogluconate aldolase / (4S)-4-hydroxy-2-oxoglutarate aldolase